MKKLLNFPVTTVGITTKLYLRLLSVQAHKKKKKNYQLINEYKSKYFYGFMDSMKPTHKHGNKLNKKH